MQKFISSREVLWQIAIALAPQSGWRRVAIIIPDAASEVTLYQLPAVMVMNLMTARCDLFVLLHDKMYK